MSETNVQLFPGVFRSTVGGDNPGFFLHSDGRVGIGNTAPEDRPAWDTDPASTAKNKLTVTGHTHITGSLNVTGHLYGDGSTLSGVAAVVGGYWDLDQANNNIKYDVGNVGIGGAAGTEKLMVHGNLRLGSSSDDTTDDDNNRVISTAGQLTIKSNDSGANNSYVNLILQSGKTNPGKIVIGGGDTDTYRDIEFYTSGSSTERMRIHHDGRVGIGVSSPDSTLEVRGNIQASHSDTNHGMILESAGTLRRDYGGSGAGFHFTNAAIWPTNYAGTYNAGGIDFGNSSYRWNNMFTESLDASSTINLGSSSSIRQTTTTWTGNPGTQGKLEYHSKRWYIVAGSDSNELVKFRRDGSDKGYITNDGHYVGGYLRSDLKIGRTSHSNGYLVGSYNSVGANDTKSNPIYTIGSNYMPSDSGLGNMYGIGYSHGNFTGYLTSGWGMYVAADGDVRIGLNGSHGHIKNSGHIYCGGTVHLSGSTSQGIRSATGNYGTVQTTGEGNGGWEGYSIDGRYVFMSASNNSCGIYNDLDNNWMIYCYRNNYTKLYYAGAERFETGNPNFINDAGLRIYGAEELYDYPDASADYWTNWNQIQADAPYYQYGLYVNNAIRAPIYVVLSDRRIKKDFLEIDDTIALDKLRQLKPTSYKYKDKMRRTTDRVLGFIAQEVAEVLPDAVSKTNAVIPNIQIEASVKKIDEEKFEFTLKEPHIVTVGSKLELKAPKFSHKDVEVISVTDDTTFTGTAKDFDIEKVGDRVIVYGEYVNDFHNLDKNAIFTVATAALQEVDRQLQAEKEKVKSLEERLAALEAIVLNQ